MTDTNEDYRGQLAARIAESEQQKGSQDRELQDWCRSQVTNLASLADSLLRSRTAADGWEEGIVVLTEVSPLNREGWTRQDMECRYTLYLGGIVVRESHQYDHKWDESPTQRKLVCNFGTSVIPLNDFLGTLSSRQVYRVYETLADFLEPPAEKT
jgi:hypothetical protein